MPSPETVKLFRSAISENLTNPDFPNVSLREGVTGAVRKRRGTSVVGNRPRTAKPRSGSEGFDFSVFVERVSEFACSDGGELCRFAEWRRFRLRRKPTHALARHLDIPSTPPPRHPWLRPRVCGRRGSCRRVRAPAQTVPCCARADGPQRPSMSAASHRGVGGSWSARRPARGWGVLTTPTANAAPSNHHGGRRSGTPCCPRDTATASPPRRHSAPGRGAHLRRVGKSHNLSQRTAAHSTDAPRRSADRTPARRRRPDQSGWFALARAGSPTRVR